MLNSEEITERFWARVEKLYAQKLLELSKIPDQRFRNFTSDFNLIKDRFNKNIILKSLGINRILFLYFISTIFEYNFEGFNENYFRENINNHDFLIYDNKLYTNDDELYVFSLIKGDLD